MIAFITQCCDDLKVSYQDAKKCFAMARMTVFDEVENIGEYESVKFVEFLDFLCRIAHFNFITMDQSLEYKL